MQSERALPRRQRLSGAPISEVCKSARSATQPCWNSPTAISNTAMSSARLARDDNGSRRAGLWWPGAGGTVLRKLLYAFKRDFSDGCNHPNRLVRRDIHPLDPMSARLDRVRPLLCGDALMALRVARRQGA